MTNKSSNQVDWAVTLLDRAETVDDVRLTLKSSARAAVGAQGATVVERIGDYCHYMDEDAMSPLWKGQRFPTTTCISGWAMLHGQTVVIPDIRVDSRIPQEAYRPTFVRSLVMVPIVLDEPIGAVGAYWGHLHAASPDEMHALELLADAAGRAMRRILAAPDAAQRADLVGGKAR
jgi:GAF domain-containing protein